MWQVNKETTPVRRIFKATEPDTPGPGSLKVTEKSHDLDAKYQMTQHFLPHCKKHH